MNITYACRFSFESALPTSHVRILPYIGYPRSLNAIACINKAAED